MKLAIASLTVLVVSGAFFLISNEKKSLNAIPSYTHEGAAKEIIGSHQSSLQNELIHHPMSSNFSSNHERKDANGHESSNETKNLKEPMHKDVSHLESIKATTKMTLKTESNHLTEKKHKKKPSSKHITFDSKVPKKTQMKPPKHSKNPKSSNKKKINRIALIGERHSGTNWITSELRKCFPKIKVKTSLVRYKHWFQSDDGAEHDDTLVVAAFRDPYVWFEAMRKIPHHSPNHLFLHWREFLTKPWTMPRLKKDLALHNKTTVICQKGFKYHEINSCVQGSKTDEEFIELKKKHKGKSTFSGVQPDYELRQDGSGEPFNSIIELRAAKIKNFLSVREWDWVTDVISIQYEILVEKGMDFLMKDVEEKIGKKRKCEPTPPKPKKKRKLKKKLVMYLNEHVDWEAEALIGYTKWNP